jgi:uncharacterized membrane protein
VFLGSALACAGLVVLAPDPLRLVAAGCYLIGVVGVTAVRNVPLNNALDRVTPDGADEAALWSRYLSRWTAWNHVRTVASAAAALALILAA